jgi:hypothetical protein
LLIDEINKTDLKEDNFSVLPVLVFLVSLQRGRNSFVSFLTHIAADQEIQNTVANSYHT